jgi:hypothetical protein
MKKQLIRLFGGHRNKVFLTDGRVKIVWKDGFKRQKQIREGVLIENFVAVHTEIKSRMLVDKSKPVEEENGELVTYFNYVQGEIRYPWDLEEIASAAKLLSRLHFVINASTHQRINNQLHLDFARGNVLFQPGTSDAIGVIDFETTAKGPVEQELGRSLSFILVDAPLQGSHPCNYKDAILQFGDRLESFLTNYALPYRKEDVIKWTKKYLSGDDFGSLNSVRDVAIQFINSLTYKRINASTY